MDTVTHAVTGLALGALAQGVSGAGNEQTSAALMWTALMASQAPDFDYLVKLVGGKTNYLKYHRTFTHTLPVMVVLSVILTLCLQFFFTQADWQPLFIWSLAAMLVHVAMDLTTSYGTKALWPLNKKMLALDWVMIIDPVILLVLGIAVLLWFFNLLPAIPLFISAFGLLVVYIAIRGLLHRILVKLVRQKFATDIINYSVIPTFSINNWHFVIEKSLADGSKKLIAGQAKLQPQQLMVEKEYTYQDTAQLRAAKQSRLGKIFVNFSRHLAVWQHNTSKGTVVIMVDLRFRFRDKYPFAAYIWLDEHMQVVKESLTFSDEIMVKAAARDELEKWE